MKIYLNILTLIYCFTFLGSCSISTPKSTTLMSLSKEESIKNGFYKGEFDLVRIYGECKSVKKLDCWGESAWKSDNILLIPTKKQLNFFNFFIKLNDQSCNQDYIVQYKQKEVASWQSTSCVLEPNFGYYLQIDKNISLDSVFIKISNRIDTCIYKIFASKRAY